MGDFLFNTIEMIIVVTLSFVLFIVFLLLIINIPFKVDFELNKRLNIQVLWFLKFSINLDKLLKAEKDTVKPLKDSVNTLKEKAVKGEGVSTQDIKEEVDKSVKNIGKKIPGIDLLYFASDVSFDLLSRTNINHLSMKMNIGIEEADILAILCGMLYGGLYSGIAFISNFFKNFAVPDIDINPHYNTTKLEVNCKLAGSIRGYEILYMFFKHRIYKVVFHFLNLNRRIKWLKIGNNT